MPREQNAVHVECFPLEPIRAGKDLHDRQRDLVFAQGRLNPNALVLAHRQQVIHDIKPALAARIVDGSNINERFILTGSNVPQMAHDLDNPVMRNGERQLSARHFIFRNRIFQR